MMTTISKRAEQMATARREYIPFPAARAAMKTYLQQLEWAADEVILMPAFIGWSKHEGSGVFDPIGELGIKAVFYGLDENLHVDIDDVRRKLATHRVKAVLVIHYFGYVDPRLNELVAAARTGGAIVIEDAAHAMLTDVIGGRCGRDGEVCLYSLHKMLPSATGGALVVNRTGGAQSAPAPAPADWARGPWHYDLHGIAAARRKNALRLAEQLRRANIPVDLLRPTLDDGIVPQTFPIRLRTLGRDKLYEDLNAAGFGVVTLYHTLVSVISRDEFPACFHLAQRILNLPVHQDVPTESLDELVTALGRLLPRE